MFPWHLVLWVYAFHSSKTPTCSPSSSLTFDLSPPGHQLTAHPFHCVRLLGIIIAAVSHLCCQALFGSLISAQTLPCSSGTPEISPFFRVCSTSLKSPPVCSTFSPLPCSFLLFPSFPCFMQPGLPGVC